MTTATNPPFVGQEWDDELEERDDVARLILRGVVRVQYWQLVNAKGRFLDGDLIAAFHRMVFENIFPDFAGKFRGPSPNYIAYNVTFGSRRGTPHEDVPDAMAALGSATVNLIRQLDDLKAELPADDFLEEVTKAAAYTHCRFIEIHPFVNGNGRTARLCVNYFLRRYDLPLIVTKRSEEPEYIDAIRSWIDHRSVDHFAQFLKAQIQNQ